MTLLNALLVLVLMLAVFPEQSTAGEESVQYYLDLHSRKVECPPCDPKRPDLNCCKDNTYSFVQPDLSLPGNGLCGPTAVSNVVVNICGIDDADPGDFAGYLNMDFNAGTTSSDLLGLLNGQANRYRCLGLSWGSVRLNKHQVGWEGIALKTLAWFVQPPHNAQRQRNIPFFPFLPVVVALMTDDPKVEGHWTVVVAVRETASGKCEVVHNTWGSQYHTRCDVFGMLMEYGGSVIHIHLKAHRGDL